MFNAIVLNQKLLSPFLTANFFFFFFKPIILHVYLQIIMQ